MFTSVAKAEIRLWASTGGAKEPGKIWRPILGIFAKGLDIVSQVAKLKDAASC